MTNAETATKTAFQSTLPKWAATEFCNLRRTARLFQSTLPKWAATLLPQMDLDNPRYFNPRCPSGQRQGANLLCIRKIDISIHAAQVGSDLLVSNVKKKFSRISIHAAQVGSDFFSLEMSAGSLYISIHAAQVGSDAIIPPTFHCHQDFNPRCPSGQRQ